MVHVTFYAQPRRNRPFLRVSKLTQGKLEEATDLEVQNYIIFTDVGAGVWKAARAFDANTSVQVKDLVNTKSSWRLQINSAYFVIQLALMEYSKIKQPSPDGETDPPENKLMSIECDGDYYYLVQFIQDLFGMYPKKKPNELSNWAAFSKITAISPPDHIKHWEDYLKVNLGDESAQRLQVLKGNVAQARNRGVNTMEVDKLIKDMEAAISVKAYPKSMDIARAIETVLEGATSEHKEMSEYSADANDAILFTQSFIIDAKKDGIDVSEAESQFHQVKMALDDRDYQKVIDLSNKTKTLIENIRLKHKKAAQMVQSTLDRLKQAKDQGVVSAEAQKQVELAQRALSDNEYDLVMEFCDKATRMVGEAQEAHKKELSLKEKASQAISAAKDALASAKKDKLNVVREERLITEAERLLGMGEEEKAIENAEQILSRIQEIKGKAGSLSEVLTDLGNQVQEMGNFMDMVKPLQSLDSAKKAFEQGDYEKVQAYLGELREVIERAKTAARPRISLGFSNKQFQTGVWNRCKLNVTNSGKADAKNIELTFSGTIEVMRIRRVPMLKAGERMSVEIGLRSNEVGEIPLDMEITYYRYYDDAKYQAQGVKWVRFGKQPVMSTDEEGAPEAVPEQPGEGELKPIPELTPLAPETQPPAAAAKKNSDIKESYTYLAKGESPDPAFKIFEGLVKANRKGMCLTRNFPKRIHEKYALGDTKVIWLTNVQGAEMIRPSDIEKIRHAISVFLNENEGAALLLDGLEYLMTHNKYENVLKFVQSLKDQVAIKRASCIIPISPHAIEQHELKLLEREVDEVMDLEKLG